MSALQLWFVVLTFTAPVLCWIFNRRWPTGPFDKAAARVQALILLAVEIYEWKLKIQDSGAIAGHLLPMQLCDWALFATAIALWFRSQICFEVAYFWGLAGTIQALFTPAISSELAWWRQVGFFLGHSVIVIGVIHLVLVGRMRPQPGSLLRVLGWSELYLATALAANALTGENYGFLSQRPDTPSLLDLFSDTRWIYVLQINLTAIVFFAVLYLPWALWDGYRAKTARTLRPSAPLPPA
ncbi:MAG: TIGR02206 family membrane protein [Verrucomicrobiota bacterium]|nr:TIGR02206 family membrane protein [Verrucomicrobiota bacterium]